MCRALFSGLSHAAEIGEEKQTQPKPVVGGGGAGFEPG